MIAAIRSSMLLVGLAALVVWLPGCIDRDAPPGTTRYNRGQVIAIANNQNRYQDRWWGDPIQVQAPQQSGPAYATTHWALVYRDPEGNEQLVRVNAHTAWVHQPVPLPAVADDSPSAAMPADSVTATP